MILTEPDWIELKSKGRLGIMPRPRGGEWLPDEVQGWRNAGVGMVVSLLEQGEIDELDLKAEAALCREANIEFMQFPIRDRGVPSSIESAERISRDIARRVSNGESAAVHCRAGIGRSGTIAACILVCLGCDPALAFAEISRARGIGVPDTAEQRAWVVSFAKSIGR
jgi:protein-tyrosine phosphatase